MRNIKPHLQKYFDLEWENGICYGNLLVQELREESFEVQCDEESEVLIIFGTFYSTEAPSTEKIPEDEIEGFFKGARELLLNDFDYWVKETRKLIEKCRELFPNCIITMETDEEGSTYCVTYAIITIPYSDIFTDVPKQLKLDI